MITIIRQYFSYFIDDSCEYSVTRELTLKISRESEPILLVSVPTYLADLRIKDSSGKELVILSELEFDKRFAGTMSGITRALLKTRMRALKARRGISRINNQKLIAVVLHPQLEPVYYEKISMHWIEQITPRQKRPTHLFSKYMFFAVNLTRIVGGSDGARKKEPAAAIYLSIKTSEKYEILGKPRIRNLSSKERVKYDEIVRDNRHKVYRFPPTTNTELLRVTVKIGLPQLVKTWARYGPVAAIGVAVAIVYMTLANHSVPSFAYETIAGVIAFIVGLRVVVFHDLTLMNRWNFVHIAAVLMLAILLFGLMYLEGNMQLRNLYGIDASTKTSLIEHFQVSPSEQLSLNEQVQNVTIFAAKSSNTAP